MVEISLSGMPATRPGDPGDPGGVAALRDGSRLVLRVSRNLGGGRQYNRYK